MAMNGASMQAYAVCTNEPDDPVRSTASLGAARATEMILHERTRVADAVRFARTNPSRDAMRFCTNEPERSPLALLRERTRAGLSRPSARAFLHERTRPPHLSLSSSAKAEDPRHEQAPAVDPPPARRIDRRNGTHEATMVAMPPRSGFAKRNPRWAFCTNEPERGRHPGIARTNPPPALGHPPRRRRINARTNPSR
jgi:hypothetical protein